MEVGIAKEKREIQEWMTRDDRGWMDDSGWKKREIE